MARSFTCEEGSSPQLVSGSPKELAYRESDGLEVKLLWNECSQ